MKIFRNLKNFFSSEIPKEENYRIHYLLSIELFVRSGILTIQKQSNIENREMDNFRNIYTKFVCSRPCEFTALVDKFIIEYNQKYVGKTNTEYPFTFDILFQEEKMGMIINPIFFQEFYNAVLLSEERNFYQMNKVPVFLKSSLSDEKHST